MPGPFVVHAMRTVSRSIVFFAALFLAAAAFATLGQDVSSIRSDQAQMNAQVRVGVGQSYSVHELSSPAGTTIREFVSPAGTVFAVSWQGAFTPDLRQLLGTHFDEYVQASQSAQTRVARMVHVETGDLVVESSGHMRFSMGTAYLRSKMPSGVTADALR
jgi:Protein of unknown function (DUF2844)